MLNSREIVDTMHLNCTPKTVNNYLNSEGYKWKHVRDTFLLEERYINQRLEFCKKHRNDDRSRTIFLDESAFRLHSSSSFAYQKESNPIIHPKPKYCHKVNACAGISLQGSTRLFTFTENLDGLLYREILDYILPDCRRMYGRNFRIVHDNDSKHMSEIAQNLFEFRHIELLED